MKGLAVVAVGGNSITRHGQEGNLKEQNENARETSKHLAEMIDNGYSIVVTHGNGPQVGNVLLRVELSSHEIYPLTLDVCGADTQGGMGYMFQQQLGNELTGRKLVKTIVTLVTQVLVDKNDPAFKNPTKPIGPFYSKEKADYYTKQKGWHLVEDAGRGFRRVVPSPRPVEIIEKDAIILLLKAGIITIAAGGGGIPVIRDENSNLKGIEAVIDKDLASSLLARQINADLFLISTDVEKVAINYKKPDQKFLDHITVYEAQKLLNEGQFAPGSMGPKIKAAIEFLDSKEKKVIITNPPFIPKAIKGESGTVITLE